MKKMSIIYKGVCALLLGLSLIGQMSCGNTEATIPTNAESVSEVAQIYPDYRDIVIPPNIAPLNVQVKSKGDAFVGSIEGGGKQIIAATDEDGVLQFDSLEWKELINAARGKDLNVTLYAEREGKWVKFPSYKITVANEGIDRYLSYRLIEPSYELYRQMGLYQRDLESFNVQTIYENNRTYDKDNNHCVNCHNYQNYSTKYMLFHRRAKGGGTIFIENGKIEKRTIKSDSILAGATYPTWYPTRNWVVFSSNQTGQSFHIRNHQKIEVVDYGSDLIFYDVDKEEVKSIMRTDTDLETFPCWAPDGKKLYYTSAHVPEFEGKNDSIRRDLIINLYDKVHYNVMSMTFDPITRTFGTPQVEVDCAAQGKSAAVTRVSPDGRYLLFSLADYGQFHIWHTSADLYVKDLQTGQVYPLTEANSKQADSYHGWSSNGRWIFMASSRDDGSFSRVYMAYFDKQGKAHKAFLLPQLNPIQNILLPKSYNVPELTKDAVSVSAKEIKEAIEK